MEWKEIDPDYETRMVQFEIDCNEGKGNPVACQSVGEYCSVVKNDIRKAAKVYADNCARYSFPPSCFNLARIILSGRIEEMSDDSEARKSLETACNGKHTKACHALATLLLHGIGQTEKDVPRAHKLLEGACKESDAESCYILANQLLKDTLKPEERNPLKAKSLLELGCDRGHAPSCFNLAVMYNKGDGTVQRDESKFLHYKQLTESLVEQAGGVLQGKAKA